MYDYHVADIHHIVIFKELINKNNLNHIYLTFQRVSFSKTFFLTSFYNLHIY